MVTIFKEKPQVINMVSRKKNTNRANNNAKKNRSVWEKRKLSNKSDNPKNSNVSLISKNPSNSMFQQQHNDQITKGGRVANKLRNLFNFHEPQNKMYSEKERLNNLISEFKEQKKNSSVLPKVKIKVGNNPTKDNVRIESVLKVFKDSKSDESIMLDGKSTMKKEEKVETMNSEKFEILTDVGLNKISDFHISIEKYKLEEKFFKKKNNDNSNVLGSLQNVLSSCKDEGYMEEQKINTNFLKSDAEYHEPISTLIKAQILLDNLESYRNKKYISDKLKIQSPNALHHNQTSNNWFESYKVRTSKLNPHQTEDKSWPNLDKFRKVRSRKLREHLKATQMKDSILKYPNTDLTENKLKDKPCADEENSFAPAKNEANATPTDSTYPLNNTCIQNMCTVDSITNVFRNNEQLPSVSITTNSSNILLPIKKRRISSLEQDMTLENYPEGLNHPKNVDNESTTLIQERPNVKYYKQENKGESLSIDKKMSVTEKYSRRIQPQFLSETTGDSEKEENINKMDRKECAFRNKVKQTNHQISACSIVENRLQKDLSFSKRQRNDSNKDQTSIVSELGKEKRYKISNNSSLVIKQESHGGEKSNRDEQRTVGTNNSCNQNLSEISINTSNDDILLTVGVSQDFEKLNACLNKIEVSNDPNSLIQLFDIRKGIQTFVKWIVESNSARECSAALETLAILDKRVTKVITVRKLRYSEMLNAKRIHLYGMIRNLEKIKAEMPQSSQN